MNMQGLGFYFIFGAFLLGAMERHLETRGRNDTESADSRTVTACFAGVVALMLASSVFLAGGERMWSVFGPILGVGALALLGLAASTILGGAEIFESIPRKTMAFLENNEETLKKYVFPFTYAVALLGLACEAVHTFMT
jgi:predicted tellurium resistance membrane protein TerC